MNELAVIDDTEIKELAVIDDTEIKEAENELTLHAFLENTPIALDTVAKYKEVSLAFGKIAKALEAKRTEAVKPALEEQRRINGIFKPTIDKLDNFSKRLYEKVSDFVKAEEKKEVERKALEAKANAEKLLVGKSVEKTDIAQPTSPAVTVSETKTWEFEVVDVLLVPRQFLTVDERKVRESIKAGVRSIPGIKIYQKTTVNRR